MLKARIQNFDAHSSFLELAIMKTFSLILASLSCLMSVGSSLDTINRQIFQIHVPRALFESFYDENKSKLDLWSATTHPDGTIEAQLVGPESIVRKFIGAHERNIRTGPLLARVLVAEDDSDAGVAQERREVADCHAQTAGYINGLGVDRSRFTDNKFHDCWRTSAQVFEYLDRIAEQTPQFLTKISSIGKTIEGHDIPVYKISTGVSPSKRSLVGQGLIHAREWQSGGSIFFVIAGFVDALVAGDERVLKVFDAYDWYFVPILNIDGYNFTWTGDRFWRKNRRVFTVNGTQYIGVDLNRNFGPVESFDKANDRENPNAEIYPGTNALSEPESAAVWKFLQGLPGLAGVIDLHMNSQAILRPYSNRLTEAEEPYGSKLTALGGLIQKAIQKDSVEYRNIMGGTGSYLAYGTFKDAVFMELNSVPAYTLELERRDGGFISMQASIRDVGTRTLASFVAFSEGVNEYWRNGCEGHSE